MIRFVWRSEGHGQLRNRCARDKKDFLKQMQKAKNAGMNGHIAKSRDINKLSEILRKIFI